MYTVAVTKDFIANHFLIGGDWGDENNPHAHHYVLELRIESEALDKHGYLVDIVEIEAALMNRWPIFVMPCSLYAGVCWPNPSLEHFARILSEKLLAGLTPPGNGALTVKLWENESCQAAYRKPFGEA